MIRCFYFIKKPPYFRWQQAELGAPQTTGLDPHEAGKIEAESEIAVAQAVRHDFVLLRGDHAHHKDDDEASFFARHAYESPAGHLLHRNNLLVRFGAGLKKISQPNPCVARQVRESPIHPLLLSGLTHRTISNLNSSILKKFVNSYL